MNCILILDDDERISAEIAEYLIHRKYQVFQADKISEARRIVQKEIINLILFDHNLPGSNGLSFIREVHQTQPEISVIMMSSSINRGLKEIAFARGVALFLQKPVHLREIQEAINKLNKRFWR